MSAGKPRITKQLVYEDEDKSHLAGTQQAKEYMERLLEGWRREVARIYAYYGKAVPESPSVRDLYCSENLAVLSLASFEHSDLHSAGGV